MTTFPNHMKLSTGRRGRYRWKHFESPRISFMSSRWSHESVRDFGPAGHDAGHAPGGGDIERWKRGGKRLQADPEVVGAGDHTWK